MWGTIVVRGNAIKKVVDLREKYAQVRGDALRGPY